MCGVGVSYRRGHRNPKPASPCRWARDRKGCSQTDNGRRADEGLIRTSEFPRPVSGDLSVAGGAGRARNRVSHPAQRTWRRSMAARIVQYASHHQSRARTPTGRPAIGRVLRQWPRSGLAAKKLAAEGFRPDIVIGHVGWGELTFFKEVWRDGADPGGFSNTISSRGGGSVGFDPEFPASSMLRSPECMRVNAVRFSAIIQDMTTAGRSQPRCSQRDTFPDMHFTRRSDSQD